MLLFGSLLCGASSGLVGSTLCSAFVLGYNLARNKRVTNDTHIRKRAVWFSCEAFTARGQGTGIKHDFADILIISCAQIEPFTNVPSSEPADSIVRNIPENMVGLCSSGVPGIV